MYCNFTLTHHFTKNVSDISDGESGLDSILHSLIVLCVHGKDVLEVREETLDQLLGHVRRLEKRPAKESVQNFEVPHVTSLGLEEL